jgi:hypothetical protein
LASSASDPLLLNNEKLIQINQAPTVGLKSLLQSSDLIELLLKPVGEPATTVTTVAVAQDDADQKEYSKSSPSHDLIEQNMRYKSLFDIDILDECLESKNKFENENQANIYGNAFFGPSLWDKSELYQSDKMGVKLQYLEVDDFLNEINENGLNEADAEFLDQFKFDSEVTRTNTINSTLTSNDKHNITSQINVSPQLVDSSNSLFSQSSSLASPHSTNSLEASTLSPITPLLSDQTKDAKACSNSSLQANKQPRIAKSKESLKKIKSKRQIDQSSNFSNDFSFDSEILSENDDSNKMTEDDELKYQSFKKSKKMSLEQLMLSNTNFDLTEIELESELLQTDDDSDDDSDLEQDLGVFDEKPQKGKKRGKKFVPNELKDDKYWARRIKNNVAAKRSRDARRMKENQIAVRAKYLERENDALRKYLDDSRKEVKLLKLKCARYETAAAANNGN